MPNKHKQEDSIIRNTVRMQMTEARSNFSQVTSSVETNPREVVQLDNRGKPTALIVSYERFSPLLKALQPASGAADVAEQLRWLLVERWLGDAEEHLKTPQRKELAGLDIEELISLLRVTPQETVVPEGVSPDVLNALSRLRRRREIAETLSAAEEEGLYEVSEHLSGEEA